MTPSPANPTRKPISIQLLSGERERLYWEALPETTRREARKFQGLDIAIVGQIKNKKKRKEEGGNVLLELEKMDLEIEKVLETKVAEKLVPTLSLLEDLEEVVVKPRKKPSKF